MGLRESDGELREPSSTPRSQSMKDDGTLNALIEQVVRRRGRDLLSRRAAPGEAPGAARPDASCSRICADPSTLDGLAWLVVLPDHGQAHRFYWLVRHRAGCCWRSPRRPRCCSASAAPMAARSRFPPLQLARQGLHRDRARRARHRLLPVLRDRARPGHRIPAPQDQMPRLGPARSARAAISSSAPAAKLPLSTAPQWVHETYGFFLAVLHLRHRLRRLRRQRALRRDARGAARPDGNRRGLRHDAAARPSGASWCRRCGSMPCPGLSNLWMILIKATPLSVPARGRGHRLLGARTRRLEDRKFTDYPHGDWRLWYFLGAAGVLPRPHHGVSRSVLARLTRRLTHGQATLGGEAHAQGERSRDELLGDHRRLRLALASASANGCCRAPISPCASSSR